MRIYFWMSRALKAFDISDTGKVFKHPMVGFTPFYERLRDVTGFIYGNFTFQCCDKNFSTILLLFLFKTRNRNFHKIQIEFHLMASLVLDGRFEPLARKQISMESLAFPSKPITVLVCLKALFSICSFNFRLLFPV